MTIHRIPTVGGPGGAQGLETGKEKFGKLLEQSGAERKPGLGTSQPRAATEPGRAEATPEAAAGKSEVAPLRAVDSVQHAKMQQAVKMVDEVNAAQQRLDQIMSMAESGRSFSPAELLAFQAHVYKASQELDLAGKVVEKATSGVKQILQTQI